MIDKIRAAVWLGPGLGFEIRALAIPELGPGQVLVRVETACICGSDLHTISGRRSSPAPGVLGHEYCGTVTALGPGPKPRTTAGVPLGLGDRVVWSVTDSCGSCTRCQRGLAQKCLYLAKYGHSSWDSWPLSGGFAEHVQLRAGTAIALVPDSLSAAVAATASCAGATVMAAIDSAASDNNDKQGEQALVIGAGMLGLYACAVLAERGLTVTVWEPQPERRRQALDFGASHALASPDESRYDLALELSGYRPIIRPALAALEVGGTLVLAGTVSPGDDVAIDPELMVRQLLTIRSVHNYLPHHLEQAVQFLARTEFPFDELVSAPYPLAEISKAFDAAQAGTVLRVAVAP